ncbi:hypothetical protein ID866_12672 [Astraeus odoratus]|nr:hypothetical protein ID866_12672 [Astraeus odoratus]
MSSLFSTLKLAASSLYTSRSSDMSSVKDFVDNTIRDHKIVIFSKTYCPFCKASKAYFSDNYNSEPVHVVELDVRDDASATQDYLLQLTGARSVPRIFISASSMLKRSALC